MEPTKPSLSPSEMVSNLNREGGSQNAPAVNQVARAILQTCAQNKNFSEAAKVLRADDGVMKILMTAVNNPQTPHATQALAALVIDKNIAENTKHIQSTLEKTAAFLESNKTIPAEVSEKLQKVRNLVPNFSNLDCQTRREILLYVLWIKQGVEKDDPRGLQSHIEKLEKLFSPTGKPSEEHALAISEGLLGAKAENIASMNKDQKNLLVDAIMRPTRTSSAPNEIHDQQLAYADEESLVRNSKVFSDQRQKMIDHFNLSKDALKIAAELGTVVTVADVADVAYINASKVNDLTEPATIEDHFTQPTEGLHLSGTPRPIPGTVKQLDLVMTNAVKKLMKGYGLPVKENDTWKEMKQVLNEVAPNLLGQATSPKAASAVTPFSSYDDDLPMWLVLLTLIDCNQDKDLFRDVVEKIVEGKHPKKADSKIMIDEAKRNTTELNRQLKHDKQIDEVKQAARAGKIDWKNKLARNYVQGIVFAEQDMRTRLSTATLLLRGVKG